MKQSGPQLPREWEVKVASHKLIHTNDLQMEALSNMLVFPLSEMQTGTPRKEDLGRFLGFLFHNFCSLAVRSKFAGWFYAWFDEASGTLRCGACSVKTPEELPFSCGLRVVDKPDEVAQAAASSPYISGIPLTELRHAETGSEEELPEFTLTVFAKPMFHSV